MLKIKRIYFRASSTLNTNYFHPKILQRVATFKPLVYHHNAWTINLLKNLLSYVFQQK